MILKLFSQSKNYALKEPPKPNLCFLDVETRVWERWKGGMACQAPCFKVRALPGCASEAKDAPGCHNMVLVTTDPSRGHAQAISALSSGIIFTAIL